MPGLSAAIVAGGRSSRMGRDKSFVLLHGKPMIEHVVTCVRALPVESVLLIANRPDDYAYLRLPTHADVYPDKGSLGGIFSIGITLMPGRALRRCLTLLWELQAHAIGCTESATAPHGQRLPRPSVSQLCVDRLVPGGGYKRHVKQSQGEAFFTASCG